MLSIKKYPFFQISIGEKPYVFFIPYIGKKEIKMEDEQEFITIGIDPGICTTDKLNDFFHSNYFENKRKEAVMSSERYDDLAKKFEDNVPNRRYGGPYDRGSADRYYGRPYNPHYFVGVTYQSDEIYEGQMTEQQIAEYKAGWDQETDRKVY